MKNTDEPWQFNIIKIIKINHQNTTYRMVFFHKVK